MPLFPFLRSVGMHQFGIQYYQATMPQIMVIVAGEDINRATNTEYIQNETEYHYNLAANQIEH
ncbi:hypothetical protein AR543_00145 [Paenibacillus bovis]|uniref:Uncharacterized protein n=1 Tax=Paenibacillus bovis TaxID=1616788 RepID=A0A172ZAD9_9BACL|nr:hypothetical protein AR543_00145 [Paenibacillus bovis]